MLRFLIALFVLAGFGARSVAEPVDGGHALVELISERHETQPGTEFYAGLKMQLDEGWHVYWRNAGDAGLPPDLKFEPGTRIQAGEFLWPAPHLLPVVPGQIMDYGYTDQIVLPFLLTVPQTASGPVTLTARVDYLICEDICIPEQVTVSMDLMIGDMIVPDVLNGELIGEAIAEVPVMFEGETVLTRSDTAWTLSFASPELTGAQQDLRFFPYTHAIVHAAEQPLGTGSSGACLKLTPDPYTDPEVSAAPLEGVLVAANGSGDRRAWKIRADDGPVIADTCTQQARPEPVTDGQTIGLVAILFFALLGGLVLNLMPCVLPVLSIKAFGLVQAAASGEQARMRAHGIWYTIGVLVSFAAIAGAFLAVRAALGSASLGFQLQYPPAVAILALIMFVLGLWFLGFVELGGSLRGAGSGLAEKQGASGAFFTGVLAAIVGAPCIGPFLGVALGAVLTQPAMIVLLVFLVLGLGLALPFLLLSFVPGLQRLLPRPGEWMVTLKQFFAFPMFLTAAWLLSVLMPLAGVSATLWTLVGAVLIGFGAWALKTAGGRMKTLALVFGVLALLAGIILPVRASLHGTPLAARAYAAKFETEVWSPARIDELIAEGRGIFVDFTASWCVNCPLNKATTLKNASVQKLFSERNIAFLVADFTTRDADIAAELERRASPGVPMYLYYPPGQSEPIILPTILSPGLVIRTIEGAQ